MQSTILPVQQAGIGLIPNQGLVLGNMAYSNTRVNQLSQPLLAPSLNTLGLSKGQNIRPMVPTTLNRGLISTP